MTDGWRISQLAGVAKKFRFSMIEPIKNLPDEAMKIILYGTDRSIDYRYTARDGSASFNYSGGFEGVIPMMERLYKQTESEGRKEWMEKFMRIRECPSCKGKRLKKKVLAIKINGKSITDVTDMPVKDCLTFFKDLKLTDREKTIAKQLLKEITSRLRFMEEVGLGYLTLSRASSTLSGGEGQRIRLATQIGSNLMGVLYVLDEPSIGLHQRDNHKLIETLLKLRDIGNTLIVVEHDEDTIRAADWVVDIGPGAGIHGGHIVFEGTPEDLVKDEKSLTGGYLSGRLRIETPKTRRKSTGKITIKGAKEHNLKTLTHTYQQDASQPSQGSPEAENQRSYTKYYTRQR